MYYSKCWANWLLKNAIKEINNVRRPEFSRFHEVIYSIELLEKAGFFWQSARIRNHLHLALKKGVLHSSFKKKKNDSQRAEEDIH